MSNWLPYASDINSPIDYGAHSHRNVVHNNPRNQIDLGYETTWHPPYSANSGSRNISVVMENYISWYNSRESQKLTDSKNIIKLTLDDILWYLRYATYPEIAEYLGENGKNAQQVLNVWRFNTPPTGLISHGFGRAVQNALDTAFPKEKQA